jgi:hypothetical protein
MMTAKEFLQQFLGPDLYESAYSYLIREQVAMNDGSHVEAEIWIQTIINRPLNGNELASWFDWSETAEGSDFWREMNNRANLQAYPIIIADLKATLGNIQQIVQNTI